MAFDPHDLQADYAKQLWTLSNAIVAFSVVQTLTFLYALKDGMFESKIRKARWLVIGAIIFSLFIDAAGVVAIDHLQISILEKLDCSLISTVRAVEGMKVFAVGLSGLGALLIAFLVVFKKAATGQAAK